MTHTSRAPGMDQGFSLVELVVALGLAVTIAAGVFAMLTGADGTFRTQPEVHDLQQRVRATGDALYRDIVAAGDGGSIIDPWSPARAVPMVFPYRAGRRSPDPPGSADPARLTIWSIDAAAPQATAETPVPSASGIVTLAPGPWCSTADPSCGFRGGAAVVALGSSGIWDAYSITSVAGRVLTLQHNLRDTGVVHPPGTRIAEATLRTYFLKTDRASALPQLVRYDGAGGADVPVADHVVSLEFELLGDAAPPRLLAGTRAEPDRTTYGPVPPPSEVVVSPFAAGENCAFVRDADGTAQPRLPPLGTGSGIARLMPSTLTDGPWCPDALNANRWDADLLRVRQVRVTLVVEAAVAALRGPAGPLFTRAGTARGTRFVPDRTARIVVSPRALAGGS